MGKVSKIQGNVIVRKNENNRKLEKKYGLKKFINLLFNRNRLLYFSLFSSLFLVNLQYQNFVQKKYYIHQKIRLFVIASIFSLKLSVL